MTIITTKNGLANLDTAGPIKIATEAEAIAGVDSTKAITPATLESAVGAQVQDLDDRITSLETGGVPPAGSASQIELDATQAGAGLAANGNYSADAGSNYITAATSLADADSKLDAQIKSNADSIALRALDTDLDALEVRVTANEGDIVTIEGNVSTLQTDLDAAEITIASNTAAIALRALDSDLDAAVLRIAANETDIADHEGRITTLEEGGGAAAVQSELDATQTGVGLNADGSYIQPSGSNYIDASTSIADAISKLDTAVATAAGDHTDITALETRVTTAEGEIDALENAIVLKAPQTAVDTIESSVGLSAAGAYVAPVGSDYLDASTSVMDALSKLDAGLAAAEAGHTDITAIEARLTTAEGNITSNDSDITALQNSDISIQSEIDATQAGAGLNADGGYTADGSSNYISGVSTLKAADSALDAQIKTNADAIALKASSAAVTALGDRVTVNEGEIDQLQLDIADKLEASDLVDIQTEIDAIETAVGLNANGTYSAHSGSNYLDSATSVKNALSLLDTEAATHAADIANIESQIDDIIASGADEAAVTALQNELDATQTGAGLTATGAYVANGSSNYITTAVSLKDADDKLDTQIKAREDEIDALDVRVTANEGDITALEAADVTLQSNIDDKADQTSLDNTNNELGTTQTSIGLNANGTYSAHSGSNYIDGATTVKGALTLLDSQIKTNEDDIATNSGLITNNANAIASNDTDIANLQSADSDLQDAIDAIEAGAGLDNDGGYTADATTNYLTAATSLKDADKKLDVQIKSNVDAIALKASQTDLTSLTGRVTTAEGDIASLEGRMDTAESDITALETLADTHESSLGLNADGSRPVYSSTIYISGTHHNALGQLDAQAKANADDISSNSDDIGLIQIELDTTQTAAGLNANGTLPAWGSTNYTSAASSLKAGIEALDAQVRTNELDIASEEGTRASEDAAIRGEIDAVETAVGLNANGTYSAHSGSNYIDGATSTKNAIGLLDSQLGTTQSDLDTAESEIDTLQSDLDAAELTIASHTNLLDTHESSIGLNADGSYTAIVGANYATDGNLKAAVGSLDSQVKTNADAIALKAASSTVSALQTEVDAIETAAGLNADGTFNSFTSTNYLNGSSSLRGALSDLDGQVKTNADAIATETSNRIASANALQTELNTTQSGAGLSATGTYTSPAGNTYLGGASLKADIALLDTQLASTQSDLDVAESSLAAAESDIADLQTLANTHESSLGLNADGSKPNYSSNNYVLNSDTHHVALGKLDAAIALVDSSGVGAIADEVDAIEVAVGLDANGDYVAPSGSNYIDGATSVLNADELLDAQIKLREDEITAVEDRATELEKRDGGLFIDAAAGKVEMDATLSQYQSFAGPFQISLIGLVNTGSTDIVYYGASAPRLSDKHFVVTADGNLEFGG